MPVRVIVADDHAVVRAGIVNALHELIDLMVVAEVGDGPALERALRQQAADCLLIDVSMPDFEPITAIGQIRQRYPALRILVVSAYDDDMYVQGLLGAGVDGYHLKDQPLSDLRLAVQRVLAGERWLSSSLVAKLLQHQPHATPLLTERQRELLHLLAQGLDNHSIAQQLHVSVKTVENHLTRIYRLLHVQSRLEAATYCIHHPEVLINATPAQSYLAPSPPPIAPIHVLLVDDNARYRQQLGRMVLKVQPHAHLHEGATIAEAQQIVRQFQPDLALIDVVLGDESGIECVRHLRHLRPHLCAVLISAYPDREFHRRGLAAGAMALLDKKDLDLATLRQVVDDVVSRI